MLKTHFPFSSPVTSRCRPMKQLGVLDLVHNSKNFTTAWILVIAVEPAIVYSFVQKAQKRCKRVNMLVAGTHRMTLLPCLHIKPLRTVITPIEELHLEQTSFQLLLWFNFPICTSLLCLPCVGTCIEKPSASTLFV